MTLTSRYPLSLPQQPPPRIHPYPIVARSKCAVVPCCTATLADRSRDHICCCTSATCLIASPHLIPLRLTSPYFTSPHLTSSDLTSSPLTSPHLASPHLTSSHLTSTPPHLDFNSPDFNSPDVIREAVLKSDVTVQRPTSQKMPSPDGKPPSLGEKPPSFGGKPPSPDGKPPSIGGKPPSIGGRPPSPDGKPPSLGGKPSVACHSSTHPHATLASGSSPLAGGKKQWVVGAASNVPAVGQPLSPLSETELRSNLPSSNV